MNLFNFMRRAEIKAINSTVWKSYLGLICGLFFTVCLTFYTYQQLRQIEIREFDNICDDIAKKVEVRLSAHALLLRNGAAFMASADTVTRSQWQAFYKQSKLDINLPGIQGFGYAIVIPSSLLDSHNQTMRKEGFPEYTVHPAGERTVYTSIIFLEPFTKRNQRAFSYDMYSEPVRRFAMELARDYDIAALTGKVLLVQETDTDLQAGALMYVPVYKTNSPTSTIKERRSAIKGWVYSPYRMNNLMRGILGHWDDIRQDRIHLRVFDDSISAASLLFDSQNNDMHVHDVNREDVQIKPIIFNGKKWLLYFAKPRSFSLASPEIVVLFSGCLISFLLFSLLSSLLNTQKEGAKIASRLTTELRSSEAKFKSYIEQSIIAIHITDMHGLCTYANQKWLETTGLTQEQALNLGWTEAIHPDDREWVTQKWFLSLETDEKWNCEYRFVNSNGRITWVEGIAKPYHDKDNNMLGFLGFSVDITERKLAEKGMQVAIDKFNLLFNLSPDIVVIIRASDLVIINYNAGFLDYFGYSKEEIMGKSMLELALWEDIRERKALFAQVIKEGVCLDYEANFFTKDGNVFVGMVSARLIEAEDGVHIILVTRDISARKLTEDALRESEEKYRLLYESAGIGIGYYDINGRVISYNSVASRNMNGPLNEFVGKSVFDLFPHNLASLYFLRMKKAIVANNPTTYEDEVLLPKGSKWFMSTYVRITNAKNEVQGIQIVSHDISALKQVESELILARQVAETNHEKYRLLFNTMSEGVALNEMLFNNQGEMIDYRILEVNDAFYSMADYGTQDVINKKATDVYKLTTNQISTFWKNHSINNETEYLEMQSPIRKCWYYVSTSPFVNNKFVTVFFDITELKNARLKIEQQNDELTQLNADKDRFMSILAHDLKSPFNAILGFMGLLTRNIRKYDMDTIERQLAIVNSSVNTTYNLLEDILTWAMSQAGKLPFSPRQLIAATVCEQAINNVKVSALAKNIDIQYSADSNIMLYADEYMLRTILINLISNAIKFSPFNSQINVQCKTGDRVVTIIVSDQGVGINPEKLDKLFLIDHKVVTVGTANEKGTGLGLFLCKDFVERHRGNITVSSEPGKGSDFEVSFPTQY